MKVESPAKILIVDDRPANLLALEVILDKKNCEIVRATSGREALNILMKEPDFALILIDALMPIMDGFETATMIRQSKKLKYIPIIFLTAQMNEPDNILKGFQSGAVDYMLKPFQPEILKAKVAVFLELYRKNKETLQLIEEKNNAERAKLVAEEATKSKQQFLANMSHEMRTPMNSIIGFTKVILKTNLTDSQREYLNAIKTSGDNLIVLINDILDFAKVDAGKMAFEKNPFKLETCISTILILFDVKIKESNLKLIKQYDASIPEVLLGDPVRLQQILFNLLGNAIKFTKEGSITVSVRMIKEDEENATVEFSVADTGIGISEDKIGNIFENFQQANNNTNRLFGGTGLGLSIAKQFVEGQYGKLTVKSKVGEGSTFSFILTFQKTNAKVETESDGRIEMGDDVKGVKVLVVEDIKLNQLLIKSVLVDLGFEIDIADDGNVAIEKLQKNKYDIVLMDLHMPKMDGFEATEHIRNKMNLQIPIIALTADVTTEAVEKCKSVGMNDYITKPVDEKLLYKKIVKHIKKNIFFPRWE